jgi:hypothetical protein
MHSFGSPFQHSPEGAPQSQSGTGKQNQPQPEGQKLQHGFIFHVDNPFAREFLDLRRTGGDSTRLNQVTVMMQNWEIGQRGDSQALRLAMQKALKAMEAKPFPDEDLGGESLADLKFPKHTL